MLQLKKIYGLAKTKYLYLYLYLEYKTNIEKYWQYMKIGIRPDN